MYQAWARTSENVVSVLWTILCKNSLESHCQGERKGLLSASPDTSSDLSEISFQYAFWSCLGLIQKPKSVFKHSMLPFPRERNRNKIRLQSGHPAGLGDAFLGVTVNRFLAERHTRRTDCRRHVLHVWERTGLASSGSWCTAKHTHKHKTLWNKVVIELYNDTSGSTF